MKRLIAFDLDGTLAESKQPLSSEIANLLGRLLDVTEVAIISGGDMPQFKKQVVSRLPGAARMSKLWLMPTTGAKLFRHKGRRWIAVYADLFGDAQKERILAAFDRALADAGLNNEKVWGERIEDRGSQITFSGLGQKAPLEAKEAWDPDRKKRAALQRTLQAALPDVSIAIGGTTSIDVTQPGMDKGLALKRLALKAGISLNDILFIGDAIFPGGNDYAAAEIGVDTLKVRDPQETGLIIQAIVACLKP